MFAWVCPNCGTEVSPSLNECPNCSKAPVEGAGAALPVAVPQPVADASVPPPIPNRRTLSPALVAIGTTIGIVALLAILYLFVLPSKKISNAAQIPAAFETVPGQASAHPLAKHLEMTGVRITDVTGGRARIRVLVVNHSAAELPDMQMKVNVRSATSPVFEFELPLRSLGPYESREMNAEVKTQLKPYELPDWQTLRAGFQLISEP